MDTIKMDFSVTVPGKVILHGEHSVVYGKTAVAASLNLKTTVKFSVAEGLSSLVLDLPCIDFSHNFQIKDLKDFFKKHDIPLLSQKSHRIFCLNSPELIDFEKLVVCIKSFLTSHKLCFSKQQESSILSFLCLFWGMFSSVDVPLPNCNLKITSELDIGAGMGSSTAYNICLAAAFLQYIRRQKLKSFSDPCEISKKDYKSFKYWDTDLQKFEKGELDLISRWGLFGDKIMHGNPSGIDNAVCTYGSIIEFRKGTHGPDIKIIPDPKLLKILLVNTKIPRDTKKLVNKVASLKDRLACVVEPILQAMDSVALSAAEVLRRMSQMSENYDPPNSDALKETLSGEISKLEDLIDVNQKLLEALGISHDALDEICRIARAEGLHGKLTGAGGGGYAFVMLPLHGSDKELCALKISYDQLHFPVQQVTLGGPGVTLEDTSMYKSYALKQSSDSSLILPVESLRAPDSGKVSRSTADVRELKAKVKEEEEEKVLDEWPWPFDLREVVKNMFESHIKEDLRGGEIAIPLKSLCAVNVPDPLPQWMDKITNLQTKVSNVWEAITQNQPHEWKDENTTESGTRNTQFGPDNDLSNDVIMRYFGNQRPSTKKHKSSSHVSKNASALRLSLNDNGRKSNKIPISSDDIDTELKSKPAVESDYHIAKPSSFREGLSAQMDHPTKWMKDQFPPYGKRDWPFGFSVELNQKHLKNIKKTHKKFLKLQKPGCEQLHHNES